MRINPRAHPMGALWLVGRVTELIVTAVSRAAPASHWLAGWPRFGPGLLIGGEYQVAASPVKMCQLESEGAGVSGLRSSWRENSSVPVGPGGDRRDEY